MYKNNYLVRYSSCKRQKVSLTEEIYNNVEIPLINCLSKSPYSNKIDINSPRSNYITPKLKNLAMQRLESLTKTQSIKHQDRSLNNKRLYRNPIDYIPHRLVSITPFKKKNSELVNAASANTSPSKNNVFLEYFRVAIEKIKPKEENSKTQRSRLLNNSHKALLSRETRKRNMCKAIKSIVKHCDNIKKSGESPEKLDTNIGKEVKVVKDFTDAMKWTSNKIMQWSQYEKGVMKEVYDQELYTKNLQMADAYKIGKELGNKSCHELRAQAKFIKKVLIRHKMKVL